MKDQIRQSNRTQRAGLSPELFKLKSERIAENVWNSDQFKNSQRIGFYHSVRGEADPASLKTDLKQFFLPVLSKNLDEGLVFIELNLETKFQNNKFNIPEPIYDEAKIVSADTLDLVLVPLLAFDKNGNRLGMGGGFYDRCFAFKKLTNSKPFLMGYAYDFQIVNSLEAESWDVGLDMIATESNMIITVKNSTSIKNDTPYLLVYKCKELDRDFLFKWLTKFKQYMDYQIGLFWGGISS